jgi:aspartate/methionine/tyrosine aminotransferase
MTGRDELLALAEGSGLPPLDLSLGVPADPPPPLARTGEWAGAAESAAYPPSAGSARLRAAAAGHLRRRYGVELPAGAVAACVGTKEFIATLPALLRTAGLVPPGRDTVLIPGLCYPTYEAGARLAGYRVRRVPLDAAYRMRLDLLPEADARRAVCLWVNSPCNPTGQVEDLGAVVAWGRARSVPVISDEAYAETVWTGDGLHGSALRHGTTGVLALHSLSKRSHAPGLRVGYYAGDPALVSALVVQRRAAGLMAPAAAQRQAALLLSDDRHAAEVRERNGRRVAALADLLTAHGLPVRRPPGGLFVWLPAPGGDGAAFARTLARRAGTVVMPGAAYGPQGHGHVRVAAVQDPGPVAPPRALVGGDVLTAAHAQREPENQPCPTP